MEDLETFQIALSQPLGATIDRPPSADVTIESDDYGIEFEKAAYEVDELGQSITLTAHRFGARSDPVTVEYRTKDLSATAGQDYVAQTGVLSFPYWNLQTNAVITIRIWDDTLVEGNETFAVELFNPTGGAVLGPNHTIVITILDNDLPSGPGHGIEGTVLTIAEQPDGAVLLGGRFRAVHGVERHGLARLNPDGSVDPSFRVELDERVTINKVAVQPDGWILVSGNFREIDGEPRNQFARLHPDGSLDKLFAPLIEPRLREDDYWIYQFPAVEAILPLADGKILIGGGFTKVDQVQRLGMARLDSTGAIDVTFSLLSQPGGEVTTILQQPDGAILLGGAFWPREWGRARNGIARLLADGTLDTTFVPQLYAGVSLAGEMDNRVKTLQLQPDGKVLVLRLEQSYGLEEIPPIVRLNPDGSLDASFDLKWCSGGFCYPWWFGPVTKPAAMALQPDGGILVGRYHLLSRILADGAVDLNFPAGALDQRMSLPETSSNPPWETGAFPFSNSAIADIQIRANGNILLGGNFVTIGDLVAHGFVELAPDGTPLSLTRFHQPKLSQGGVVLRLTTPQGGPLMIQSSSDLQNWFEVLSATPSSNLWECLDPAGPSDSHRFYRAIQKPASGGN